MQLISILFVIFLIQNGTTRQLSSIHNSKYAGNANGYQQKVVKNFASNIVEPTLETKSAELEIDTLKCPIGCVCQYAHFMDLPISRWIDYLQKREPRRSSLGSFEESLEELINNNEALYDVDENFLFNPYIKQATCILQVDDNPAVLVNSLPHDLQALILLYTGIGRNKTVNTSVLKPLNQLTTLEIRGTEDYTFKLIFDEPLNFLQHANFESIMLSGSENSRRPKNSVHPSDSFDYKPKSEFRSIREMDDTKSENSNKLLHYELFDASNEIFDKAEDNLKIIAYEDYLLEVEKSRRVSFYGWDHLEVLRIHSCHLSKLRWEMFDGLETLKHLSLERNNIEIIPPFALYGARNIKTLSLAHNHIHDLHYRALAGLLELKLLDLNNNKLSKLSELSFPPFPKLELVDFRNNPIKYIFPATFWVMNKTRLMDFGSSEQSIEIMINMPFESLVELKELVIGNMSINSLDHNVFKGLQSLEKLQLRGNIRNIEFDAFAAVTELRELDISHCQIQDLSMDAFIGCKKLKMINMAHNNLSYIPPGLFDDQPLLEEIFLQHNQLLTLPTTVFQLPKLRLARLHDNPWKCSCAMRNWRSKTTNRETGSLVNRCVTDFMTGKKISCRSVDSYELNIHYAPRCKNYNGRSVFYVLRKQLQCNAGRVVHTRRTNRKLTKVTPQRNITDLNYFVEGTETSAGASHISNRLKWQIENKQKIQRTMASHKNSLDYVLKQEQKKIAHDRHKLVKSAATASEDVHISNEI